MPFQPRNGAEQWSCAPFRGYANCHLFPTAYAVGYVLSLLRSLAHSRALERRSPSIAGIRCRLE